MKFVILTQGDCNLNHITLGPNFRWPMSKPFIANSGSLGLEIIEEEEPDLVIITDDLTDMKVNTLVREVRCFSDVPLAVIKDGTVEDLVSALQEGADDYIRLPTSPIEIMARVVAMLRRAGMIHENRLEAHEDGLEAIECGDMLICPSTYEVFLKSVPLPMTPKEFKLLLLLARNRSVTLTRERIQRIVWHEYDGEGADLLLKKYIQRLRQKLGDDPRNPAWIKTIHGVGYHFSPPLAVGS